MRRYTSNLMKGGAMVAESLALLREWQPRMSPEEFTEAVVRGNLLGKATRARAKDVVKRIFFRRFTGEQVPDGSSLQAMVAAGFPDHFIRRLLYYHTALSDDLLYDFASERLFELYQMGRSELSTTDAVEYINDLVAKSLISPPWSHNITHKTARGVLAALRDFGLLEGKAEKRFTLTRVPLPVFLYVAYHLKDRDVAGNRLLTHEDWRLFLLSADDVERLYLEAHQLGHLGYYAAGGIIRVEWTYDGLSEAVRALAETAH